MNDGVVPVSVPLLDSIHFWILVPIVVALVALPSAAGFWIGRRTAHTEPKSDQSVSTKVGATLGLLAFTLAFTFSMAASRYDTRRHLVIEEANALETMYYRTVLISGDLSGEVRQLLREYVDIRLAAMADLSKLPAALARSHEIHVQLWQHAGAMAEKDATSWSAAWFIESLTQVTEIHNQRVAAGLHSRIPHAVWLALGIVTTLTMLGMGYQAGLTGGMHLVPMIILVIAFATIIALIADLDRPQGGLVKIGTSTLTELQGIMHHDAHLDLTNTQAASERR